MSNKNIKVSSKLIEDMQKYGNDIAKYIATYTRDTLYNNYMEIMKDFYDDYSPKSYHRTYQMKKNSYKKYYRNSHGNTYYGGIQLTPDDISPNNYTHVSKKTGKIYGMPNEVIFNWVTFGGFHGSPTTFAYKTSPSPYNKIITTRDEILHEVTTQSTKFIYEVRRRGRYCFQIK